MAEQERVNIRTRQAEGIQALRDKNNVKSLYFMNNIAQYDYAND